MRISLTAVATAAIVTVLAGASAVACSSHPNSATPSSGSASKTQRSDRRLHQVVDQGHRHQSTRSFHRRPGDEGSERPERSDGHVQRPGPQPHDRRHHSVTLNPQAAASALDSAKGVHREALRTKALNAEVGVGGVTIEGLSEDRSKGVTVLLFTEGKAFVTLEFDGPPEMLAPFDFVTEVGQKQDEAIKKGLGG